MTYEELQKMNADLEKQADKLYRQQTFCKDAAFYIIFIQPSYSGKAHLLNFRISVHKRIGSKAKLNRLYLILQSGYLFIEQFKRIGYKKRAAPLLICFDLTESLFKQKGIARIFTAVRTAEYMIHGIITVLDTSLVEHTLSFYVSCHFHHFTHFTDTV